MADLRSPFTVRRSAGREPGLPTRITSRAPARDRDRSRRTACSSLQPIEIVHFLSDCRCLVFLPDDDKLEREYEWWTGAMVTRTGAPHGGQRGIAVSELDRAMRAEHC
jgi:hypothetical protein